MREAPRTLKGDIRARTAKAEANAEVLIDADEEQPGRLPAAFRAQEGALLLVLRCERNARAEKKRA